MTEATGHPPFEPSLDDMLQDPVVLAVLRRDRPTVAEVLRIMEGRARQADRRHPARVRADGRAGQRLSFRRGMALATRARRASTISPDPLVVPV